MGTGTAATTRRWKVGSVPALFRYFHKAPAELYVKAEAKEG